MFLRLVSKDDNGSSKTIIRSAISGSNSIRARKNDSAKELLSPSLKECFNEMLDESVLASMSLISRWYTNWRPFLFNLTNFKLGLNLLKYLFTAVKYFSPYCSTRLSSSFSMVSRFFSHCSRTNRAWRVLTLARFQLGFFYSSLYFLVVF